MCALAKWGHRWMDEWTEMMAEMLPNGNLHNVIHHTIVGREALLARPLPTTVHHSKSIPFRTHKIINTKSQQKCFVVNLIYRLLLNLGKTTQIPLYECSTSNIQLWLLLFKYFNSTTAIFHLSLFTCGLFFYCIKNPYGDDASLKHNILLVDVVVI